jgi:branched-chain amino acid transport system ATP-binding protein
MKGKSYAIEIEKLISGYGNKNILHGVNIKIEKAQVTTLIGRNGVGKTTLMETIMGFLKPKEGRITFMDKDISKDKPHKISKMGISYVPQGKAIFPNMTIEEHIDLGSWALKAKMDKKNMANKIYDIFSRLNERRRQKAGTLSGGERQMLSIARSMMSNPRLLLLDEPSFGLSPVMVDKVFKSINAISKEGVTIFMVEQNAKRALKNSKYGYVMDMGTIIFEDKSINLLNNDAVKSSYLGGNK